MPTSARAPVAKRPSRPLPQHSNALPESTWHACAPPPTSCTVTPPEPRSTSSSVSRKGTSSFASPTKASELKGNRNIPPPRSPKHSVSPCSKSTHQLSSA
eukprot:3938133-Rhodomonas_salina.1